MIAFIGTIFANCLPCGVYTTNSEEACHYVAEHSECELVVCDTEEQLNKYLNILHRLPRVRGFVVWNSGLQGERKATCYTWEEFLKKGALNVSDDVIIEKMAK